MAYAMAWFNGMLGIMVGIKELASLLSGIPLNEAMNGSKYMHIANVHALVQEMAHGYIYIYIYADETLLALDPGPGEKKKQKKMPIRAMRAGPLRAWAHQGPGRPISARPIKTQGGP